MYTLEQLNASARRPAAPATTQHLSTPHLAWLIAEMALAIVACMVTGPLMLVCFGSIS